MRTINLQDRFEKYHREHPQVYAAIQRFTFEAIKAGHKRLSIAFIFERIRWFSTVESHEEPFKFPNAYRAFYARLFHADFPTYRGFFRTRKSIADAAA